MARAGRMFTKVKEIAVRQKIIYLLKKYNVELKHHTPGRVRVKLSNWRSKQEMLQRLLGELEQDIDVKSIEFTEYTGSVLIHYNEAALKDSFAHNRWTLIFEKYNF